MRLNKKFFKRHKALLNSLSIAFGLALSIANFIYSCSIDAKQIEFQATGLRIQQEQLDLSMQPKFILLSSKQWPEDRNEKAGHVYRLIQLLNRGNTITPDRVTIELYSFLEINRSKGGEYSEELVSLRNFEYLFHSFDTALIATVFTIDIDEFNQRFDVDPILVNRSENGDLFLNHGIYVCKVKYLDSKGRENIIYYQYDNHDEFFREIGINRGDSLQHLWQHGAKINLERLSANGYADLLLGETTTHLNSGP